MAATASLRLAIARTVSRPGNELRPRSTSIVVLLRSTRRTLIRFGPLRSTMRVRDTPGATRFVLVRYLPAAAELLLGRGEESPETIAAATARAPISRSSPALFVIQLKVAA